MQIANFFIIDSDIQLLKDKQSENEILDNQTLFFYPEQKDIFEQRNLIGLVQGYHQFFQQFEESIDNSFINIKNNQSLVVYKKQLVYSCEFEGQFIICVVLRNWNEDQIIKQIDQTQKNFFQQQFNLLISLLTCNVDFDQFRKFKELYQISLSKIIEAFNQANIVQKIFKQKVFQNLPIFISRNCQEILPFVFQLENYIKTIEENIIFQIQYRNYQLFSNGENQLQIFVQTLLKNIYINENHLFILNLLECTNFEEKFTQELDLKIIRG